MVLDLIALIAGIMYGYLKPGKEDKKALLKKGLLIGIIFSILFAGLAAIAGRSSLMFFAGSIIAIIIGVLFLTVLFIIGTFIGDWLEVKFKAPLKA